MNADTQSNLVPFAFGDNLVRCRTDAEGNPWFVAKDVALALDYQWNGMKNIQHVPEEWRVVESVSTTFGERETLFLSEPGLYFFLGRSDKPKALPFQKWLAGEVLPALRRTGRYEMPGSAAAPAPSVPHAARWLRPVLREKVLNSAVQVAKLCGNTSPAFVDSLYARYCEMVSGHIARREEFSGPLDLNEQAAEVRRFVKECLVYSKNAGRIAASSLYAAFRAWWEEENGSESIPATQKLFGMVLKEFFPSVRRGGHYHYCNVTLRREA